MLANLRSQCASSLAEFGPALLLLAVFAAIPVLCVLRIGLATTACSLATNEAASEAASSQHYADALSSARYTIASAEHSTLMTLAGIQSCKDAAQNLKMYVVVLDPTTKKTLVFGPNLPLSKDKIQDEQSKLYEIEIVTSFEIAPLVPGNLPGLSEIQGLGKAGQISFSASKNAEFSAGLFDATQ